MPVFVVVRNQLSYTKKFIERLECYASNITIIDNGSTYGPLLDYYANEYKHQLIKLSENIGPRKSLHLPEVKAHRIFGFTDPDMGLNDDLPCLFLEFLMELTKEKKVFKAGMALNITDLDPELTVYHPHAPKQKYISVAEHEGKFWTNEEIWNHVAIYHAAVDTTFSVVNLDHFKGDFLRPAVRVGGPFTAEHLPWRGSWLNEAEKEFYYKNNAFSHQ